MSTIHGIIGLVLYLFATVTTATLKCSVNSIAAILPKNVTVHSVTALGAGSTYGQSFAQDPEFPAPAPYVPSVCAVYVKIPSSANSSYNLGLFLPTVAKWNSRFLMTGNGGFGGGINWPDMATFAQYGFASASTDTGHLAIAFDATWAINNPEAQTDWGYRAMHGSVVLAKLITEKYYNAPLKYSYYSGCSTGGRQGLKEVQMFPNDFDGVLAGAPAWWTTHLQTWSAKVGLYNLPQTSPHHIPWELLVGPVAAEVMRQCDPQDGVMDGIISDAYGCDFYPEALACTKSSKSGTCLTPAQLDTLYHIYNDYVETNQTFVFPHYALGSELQNVFLLNVTDESGPSPAGTSWIGSFLFNQKNWDWHNYSYAIVELADSLNPGQANADDFASMSTFFQKGGKLIQYHGLSDGLISTGSSIYFYKRVLQTLSYTTNINLPDHYRFFLIPGMQHCAGSVNDAPWNIAGASQSLSLMPNTTHSVPGFSDANHDALLALMRWVENGTAPDQIIATKFVNDTPSLGVARQRPLCPFPQQAKYNGHGNVNVSSSWECREPWDKTGIVMQS